MTENIGFLYIVQMQISGSFDFKGHKNLNQQKIFNSRDGFFRKSPFCTFYCINLADPGACYGYFFLLPFS